MDHFVKIRRPFLDTSPLSSPLIHESESESSDESGSETPSPPARSAARFPLFTPPLEQNGSSDKSPNVEPENGKGWYEFDLSVIVALVSPIGNWLTGGDHIKNLLLILLLIFYLHQIIQVPWSLYHLSRPRLRSPTRQMPAEQEVFRHVASSELRTLEMFYLSLTIFSPLLGAALLRAILISMTGPDAISWFSTSLFIFATGVRPWKHLVERLRRRTQDLHTFIHHPPDSSSDAKSQIEALTGRIARLEAQLNECKDAMKVLTEDVFDHMEGAVDGLEGSMRKQEKKNDTNYSSQESRLAMLEQNVEGLLEKKEISVQESTLSHHLVSAFYTAVEPLAIVFPQWGRSSRPDKLPPSPRPPAKLGRPRAATKLETIPEGAVFTSKKTRYRCPSFRIPGLNYVLRIGDLATLPVRRIVAFLLTGRIYSPRVPNSSP
ncbi:hypothetical protein K503DRAFT_425250 [Rhizopogon vinicolor AM-OR11-026]|uniref:Uncharacterized protein n=1 Tax=Rhizopogon vinicolor AM-OR11-026 TaxID=1314800 RepID=A0A1B7MQ40_9AGAM|nr:hypothetical protein K503DRAFT_425250 [Rhizopogon vinicolor AM-OR11-026]